MRKGSAEADADTARQSANSADCVTTPLVTDVRVQRDASFSQPLHKPTDQPTSTPEEQTSGGMAKRKAEGMLQEPVSILDMPTRFPADFDPHPIFHEFIMAWPDRNAKWTEMQQWYGIWFKSADIFEYDEGLPKFLKTLTLDGKLLRRLDNYNLILRWFEGRNKNLGSGPNSSVQTWYDEEIIESLAQYVWYARQEGMKREIEEIRTIGPKAQDKGKSRAEMTMAGRTGNWPKKKTTKPDHNIASFLQDDSPDRMANHRRYERSSDFQILLGSSAQIANMRQIQEARMGDNHSGSFPSALLRHMSRSYSAQYAQNPAGDGPGSPGSSSGSGGFAFAVSGSGSAQNPAGESSSGSRRVHFGSSSDSPGFGSADSGSGSGHGPSPKPSSGTAPEIDRRHIKLINDTLQQDDIKFSEQSTTDLYKPDGLRIADAVKAVQTAAADPGALGLSDIAALGVTADVAQDNSGNGDEPELADDEEMFSGR